MSANVIPEIQAFAQAMQFKLDKNAHKDGWPSKDESGARGWRNVGLPFLLSKLDEEVSELAYAAYNGTADEAKYEAADVGNIAWMIADICSALRKQEGEVCGSEEGEI